MPAFPYIQAQGYLPIWPFRWSTGSATDDFISTSQNAPSVCFLYHKRDLFSPSAIFRYSCRHDRPVKGWFKQLISPNSSERFLSGLRLTQLSVSLKNGTCWLHFTPTSPVLSFQEVYFSVTRTVYFGLQADGHSLLQECSPVLSLHSFTLLKSEDKCAIPPARTVLGPLPTPSI